jgi:hypothetical protein
MENAVDNNDSPLEKRLSKGIRREAFERLLDQMQVPCPWGDLQNGEGTVKGFLSTHNYLKHIPLALALRCGNNYNPEAYRTVAMAYDITWLLYSDSIEPHDVYQVQSGRVPAKDYIQINLRNPETINLFGRKVHAVISRDVFTDDNYSAHFPDRMAQEKAVEAISNLLMPGGIVANYNQFNKAIWFENLLKDHHGFKVVSNSYSTVLQKPF